jgi:CRISPR-associated protein Cas2
MKQGEKLVWILYDIVKNKTRTLISRECKNYGLYRVQKSCFLGTMNRNQIDEIALMFKEIIDEKVDSVGLYFPLL